LQVIELASWIRRQKKYGVENPLCAVELKKFLPARFGPFVHLSHVLMWALVSGALTLSWSMSTWKREPLVAM